MLKSKFLGKTYSPAEVVAEMPPSVNHSLLEVANLFVDNFFEKVSEGIRADGTLNHWRSTTNRIKKFAYYKHKASNIALNLLDDEFADEIFDYLSSRRRKFLNVLENRQMIIELDKTTGKGKVGFRKRDIINLQEVCTRREMKHIKRLLKIAKKKKWLTENPLEDFKTSGGDKEVQPLELYGVYVIYNKKFFIKRLEVIRDIFIVKCFTDFAFQESY